VFLHQNEPIMHLRLKKIKKKFFLKHPSVYHSYATFAFVGYL